MKVARPPILIDPAGVPTEAFADLPPLVAPNVGSQPLPDGGHSSEPLEPLKNSSKIAYLDAYARWGILPPRQPRLRSGALKRLRQAAANLPPGFGLVVLDSWRSLDDQQALGDFYGPQAVSGGFVAPVAAGNRPPHTTGGTVDLSLSFEGRPLALGTEFDAFSDLAAAAAFEADGANPHIRQLRRALALVMSESGFAPYWREWWHWSYGDDRWSRVNDCLPIYGLAID